MSRMLVFLIALVPSLVFAAAPVPAGKPGAIPTEIPVLAKSMIVVQVNGLDKVKEKIGTFLKSAFPKEGESLAKQLDEKIIKAL